MRFLSLALASKTRSLYRKVERSLKRRGVAGTLDFCIRNTPSVVTDLIMAGRRTQTASSEFDRRFHVDTSGEIHLTDLEIDNANSAFGNSYQPSPPRMFFEMLGVIDIRHGDYTFVDLGSGKGLVLLLASNFPFRRIVGVEFSPQLHCIAERNIRNYRNPAQRCRRIESLLGDVVEYQIPEEQEVLYLFNPFNERVMEALVSNIRRSLENHPRSLFILYKNPTASAIFQKEELLKTVRLTKEYAIYEHEGPRTKD
jgi:hypothetical protein